jgi:hypothetical protein
VVAAVPFQELVAQAERVAISGGNYRSGLRSTALRSREIKPNAP